MSSSLHSLTLPEILEEHRRSRPQGVAVVGEGRRWTYPEFADRVQRLANALEDAGVQRDDRILWLAQNHPGVLEGIIAAGALGAMFCPVNWRQSADELAFIIDDLEPRVVIWQAGEIGGTVLAARERASFRAPLWLALDGAGGYEDFIGTAAPQPRPRVPNADAPALVVYTAAFGGRPNGAMLSQRAITWQDMALIDIQDLSAETCFLNSGPLFHVGTLMVTLAVFHIAGTNVFIRRTDTEAIAQQIHEQRCSYAFLMQSTCAELVALNREHAYDFSCLRSASVSPEWDAMVQVQDSRSLFGYGQTEAMGPVSWAYYGWGHNQGRNGRTGPVAQLRILDEAGHELPPGEVGEICLRGPTVMQGYWRRPELNTQRQRDGWHHTNDLGRREADGSLSFIGPKVQMIKSGAENIYPAEVEGCLRQHPGVADAAVIGVPDATWVQSVKALVVLKPGAEATPEALIAHCRERIASYKKPRFVVFVPALPRTPQGAIDYAALDAAHGGGGYPGGLTRGA
ncbi:AMP-binding protein [Aquabacterium sp.]|uniref:AMP-binding protein n=1 Tax=Aquabacterium sp. TaxID=1872578 RepID=UPI002C34EDC6|nr:AMP-binding protein [Aquabacterium sp.]HSW04925.1 AMP-binding protein [Aquabacterium sp.]